MPTDNEVRGSKLAERVEEIEKLIRSGAAVPGTSLASLLNTAQAQLDANRFEEEHVASEKKEKEAKDRSAIAAMVERETKLNEEEKKKYAEFLSKDYFAKSDIADLERFYADGGAYDRLSDDGKVQMSNRIEEGIRRGEFSRDDLSDRINRKNDEIRGESSRKEKSSIEKEAIRSGNYQTESSKVEDSVPDVNKPDRDTVSSKLGKKANDGNELAGLAKLSPVQETDSVVVPQTDRSGESRVRGG